MNNKFTFMYDTAIANYKNGKMVEVIEKAIADWNCLTGIDWGIGNEISFSGSAVLEDQLNIISFHDYPSTSSTLSGTFVRHDKTKNSLTNPTDSSYQIFEIDMRINSDYDWFCDTIATDTIPNGEKDFYFVILHELGHAHGLKHVIDVNAIMHYTEPTDSRLVDLKNDLSCDKAGNWMANYTNNNSNVIYDTDYDKMIFDTLRPCSKVLSIIEFTKNEHIDITIFPNPCSYQLNIQFKNFNIKSLQIGIFDIKGRLLSEHNIENTKEHNEDVSFLTDGIYFIRVYTSQGQFLGASKFIKK